LQHSIPPDNTRPVLVFSQDESRFGLLTVRRRRLTGRGIQPVGRVQHTFAWFYVYGAVAPTTGECFFLELPHLNADTFQIFIDAFAHAFPDSLNILLLYDFGLSIVHRSVLIGGLFKAPRGEPTMRTALPVITEAVEHLKQRLQRAYDGRQKPRLQMLS
jgi:hypothetical protein